MPKKLPPIPASHKLKFRQSLSIPGLLAKVRKEFESIKEHRIKTISYKLTLRNGTPETKFLRGSWRWHYRN